MAVSKAVIVAGGSSRRMNGIDKTFAIIAGKPVIAHTLLAFQQAPSVDSIILVLPKEKIGKGWSIAKRYGISKLSAIRKGSRRTRQQSVANGLRAAGKCDIITVHDGARPCVSIDSIERSIAEAAKEGAAIAAAPAHETMKRVGSEGYVQETIDRSTLWSVHTPQAFRSEILLKAHRSGIKGATDDAMLAELSGYKVKVYADSYDNIKITTKKDLGIAESILKEREAEITRRAGLQASR